MFGAELCGERIWQADSSRFQYCREQFGAKEFIYSARDENTASNRLAKSFGFSLISSAAKTDSKDGHQYNLLRYSLKL